MAKKTKTIAYDADSIKVLKGADAVRKRPGMYIGDTDDGTGLHHMCFEVIDNAIDEAQAGFCDKITVNINADKSITVIDNGRGIPVSLHKEMGVSAATVAMTELHAGGKFDDKSYEYAGGLHGVGVSVVNFLSATLEMKISRDGRIYYQKFVKGVPEKELTAVGKTKNTGTTITFVPDNTVFNNIKWSYETLCDRLQELAYLNAGLLITITDCRKENKIKTETFKFPDGIKTFIKEKNSNVTTLNKQPFFVDENKDGVLVKACLQWNDTYKEQMHCYTNSIKNQDGGTHQAGLRNAITRALNKYATDNKQLKNEVEALTGEDTREGLLAVLSIKVKDPKFSSQTKDKLVSSDVRPAVEAIVYDNLLEYLNTHPVYAKLIVNKCIAASKARTAARKAKELVRRKSALATTTLPGKLTDCQERDPDKCEIFIVEGESAAGCLFGNVIIHLRNEDKKIKDVIVGDEVLTHTGEYKKVKDTFTTYKEKRAKLSINGDTIVCSADHPFLVQRNGKIFFLPLEKSTKDDYFVMLKKIEERGCTYQYISADSVEFFEDDSELLYDIEVEDNASFVLADGGGVVVHNSAKQGRDRKNQAVLPIKGKVLNVEKANLNKILSNKEIQNIVTAVGTGVHTNFDISTLRYGKIIIMTDADIDGAHIRTLLLTFFYRYMNELVSNGNIYVAQSPLYKIKVGATSHYALNDIKRDKIIKECVEAGKSFTMQRYKGLGEINPEQLWETTMNPDTRTLVQVLLNNKKDATEMFRILMGSDIVARKKFIEEHALEANIDV